MKSLAAESTGEIVEKKSRFIATMIPVTSEEEARDFIASMKKKYYDARHNCSAYTIGENHEITKSSDDGEPSGTAGRPMLDVLIHSDIHNLCVVVTRYFGGVLLGTGGLVRAYTDATKAALENAQVKEELTGITLIIDTDYNGYGKINYFLESEKIPVIDSSFTDKVTLTIFVREDQADNVSLKITELTNATAIIEKGETYILER